MDRFQPLAVDVRVALGGVEVLVVPVEPEQLAAAQAGEGEEAEQQPIAFALAREVACPDVVALDDGKKPPGLLTKSPAQVGLSIACVLLALAFTLR